MILIDKYQFVKVTYNKEIKTLSVKWMGYSTTQGWKDSHYDIVKLLDQYEIDKILVDSVTQLVISKADSDWVSEVIMPELRKRGLKFVAMVLAKDDFTRYAIEHFSDLANEYSPVKCFDDYEDAEKWLLACN